MMFRTTMLLAFSLAAVNAAQDVKFHVGDRIEAILPAGDYTGGDDETWYPGVWTGGNSNSCAITFDHQKPACCGRPKQVYKEWVDPKTGRPMTRPFPECDNCEEEFETGTYSILTSNVRKAAQLGLPKEGEHIETDLGRRNLRNLSPCVRLTFQKFTFLRVDPIKSDSHYLAKPIGGGSVTSIRKQYVRRPRNSKGGPVGMSAPLLIKVGDNMFIKEGSTVEVKYTKGDFKGVSKANSDSSKKPSKFKFCPAVFYGLNRGGVYVKFLWSDAIKSIMFEGPYKADDWNAKTMWLQDFQTVNVSQLKDAASPASAQKAALVKAERVAAQQDAEEKTQSPDDAADARPNLQAQLAAKDATIDVLKQKMADMEKRLAAEMEAKLEKMMAEKFAAMMKNNLGK